MDKTSKLISCYDKKRLRNKSRKQKNNVVRERSPLTMNVMGSEMQTTNQLVISQVTPENIHRQQKVFISKMSESYSPDASKYIVSLRDSVNRLGNIDICNHGDMRGIFKSKDIGDIEIRIGDPKVKKCVSLKSKSATDHMLSSLRNPRPLDIDNVIFPIQLDSNCWFNTWFVAMFISDKGKKFTRFLREKMITGRLAKKYGPHMKHTMKLLNLCIECSYNRGNYESKYVINTNSVICHLAQSSETEYKLGRISPRMLRGIYSQGEGGNPVEYYRNLLYHLVSPVDNFSLHTLEYEDDIVSYGKRIGGSIKADEIIVGETIPDIVNIRTYSSDLEQHIDLPVVISGVYHFGDTIKVAGRDGKRTNYVLDSIIIRDVDKYHFIILFTCNKIAYIYDGELSTPVIKYNWKKEMLKDGKQYTIKYDDKTSLKFKLNISMCEYFYYRV